MLDRLYKNNIPYSLARRFLDRLMDKTTGPVDSGFLELLRTVDLGDTVVRRLGKDSGVRPPVPISQPLPLYTAAARAAKVEGVIHMKCVILEDGSAVNFTLVRSLGYGLDESAVLTIQNRWKFHPGTLEGTPVPVEANIEINMRLY